MSNLVPLGFRVLIDPEDLEEVTEGGIVIPETISEKHKVVTQTGVIAAVGRTAWKGFDDGKPWAEKGDRVLFAKYGAKRIKDPIDGKDYAICNDEDVLCVISENSL